MRQYDAQHSGAAIVCGGGPTLYSDLDAARKARPGATVVGVNFSCCLIHDIEHVWTQHIEIAGKIKESAGRPVFVHSRPRKFQTKSGGGVWMTGVSKAQEDQVDFLWPDLGWVGGSSGFAAALWARHGMGFKEVILAGIPLSKDSRKYDQNYHAATYAAGRGPQHDGGNHFASPDSVEHWHACIRSFVDQGRADDIYSMSGETQRILGSPP